MIGYRDDVLVHGLPALDEAGQYDRADAPPGRTVWDLTSSLTLAAIIMPDRARDTILDRRNRRHDPSVADLACRLPGRYRRVPARLGHGHGHRGGPGRGP